MHPGGARRKGASGQVTNNGAKWQESEAGEGEDGKKTGGRKEKGVQDRARNVLFLLFLEKILLEKINSTCPKSKVREETGPVASPCCHRNLAEPQNHPRLSCHSEQLSQL